MKLGKLLGTAALVALIAGCAHKADAADKEGPGGTCCADLEERVAELEHTVARKGNSKVRLVISGQVNTALVWHNVDALDTKYKIVDNDLSESRLNFKGTAQINKEWSAGFAIVLGVGDAVNDGSDIDVRESYLFLKVKNFGTFSLGQQSMATDGIQEISLSRGAANASTLGSLSPFSDFIQMETGIGLVNPFDGTRKQGIKFSTDSLAGFRASASWSDDESWGAALRYAGEFGDIRIAAGIGYRDEEESATTPRTYYGGSASIMHMPSGLFIDGTYGKSDGIQAATFTPIPGLPSFTIPLGDAVVETYGGRGGFDAKLSEIGRTTIFGEYQVLNIEGVDGQPSLYGVGFNQAIDAAAMDVYVSYRHIETDNIFGFDESADVIVAGAKIKF